MRVEAVGICGSDLHWFEEGGIGDAQLAEPLVIGHEFAGVVEGGPLDGRRVAVDPALHCGDCERCLGAIRTSVPDVVFAGHGSCDGGLRRYLSWPTGALHPLPDSMDGTDGAMLEPLGVAVHALDLGHVHLGSDVAVVGCGRSGCCSSRSCARRARASLSPSIRWRTAVRRPSARGRRRSSRPRRCRRGSRSTWPSTRGDRRSGGRRDAGRARGRARGAGRDPL